MVKYHKHISMTSPVDTEGAGILAQHTHTYLATGEVVFTTLKGVMTNQFYTSIAERRRILNKVAGM